MFNVLTPTKTQWAAARRRAFRPVVKLPETDTAASNLDPCDQIATMSISDGELQNNVRTARSADRSHPPLRPEKNEISCRDTQTYACTTRTHLYMSQISNWCLGTPWMTLPLCSIMRRMAVRRVMGVARDGLPYTHNRSRDRPSPGSAANPRCSLLPMCCHQSCERERESEREE